MEPNTNTPDPYDYNPADAGTDRPEREEAQPAERAASAPTPTPIHGIAGILAMIPRDTPDGMWATVRIPEAEAEHSAMTEVGVVIRRETVADALDRVRVKLPASEVDALMAATGYALSAITAHLIVGAVMFAQQRKTMPAQVEESFTETASRMASVDARLAPIFRLVESLSSKDASPSDKRSSLTRSEIMAGSAVMGSLVRHDGHLVSLGSAIALATAQGLAHELGLEGPDGTSK